MSALFVGHQETARAREIATAELLRIAASYLRDDAVNLSHITASARLRFQLLADRAENLADALNVDA